MKLFHHYDTDDDNQITYREMVKGIRPTAPEDDWDDTLLRIFKREDKN